jgi:hypothetical protein
MERSLIWIEGETTGWACSNCRWRFLVPTLLAGDEAMAAYDRLAAAKFREHKCEAETTPPVAKQESKRVGDASLASRARMLIMRGFKPKDAVDLVLREIAMEAGNDKKVTDSARAQAEDFLMKIRKGLI